ncbi:hypothetical protein [Pseudomonas viridiflava]|uniref:hypothetical protein n=1 Tax=Pseudomonas viridiflava TaxID=33069 RepID=UPI000F0243EF|nr:hypothetical protein [Pseudomonas viridiflava]
MIVKDSKPATKPSPDESSSSLAQQTPNVIPKICLVDTEAEVAVLLAQKLYDCTAATLGGNVNSPKKTAGMQSYLRPLVRLPSNLHEFHVVVVDLAKTDAVEESEARADLKDVSGKKAYALISSYPEQVFNSKGFGAKKFFNEIREVVKKESVVIIFAAENKVVDYDLAAIEIHGPKFIERLTCETLRLCDGVNGFKNKYGKEIELYKEETRFHSILSKYLSGAHYEVIFSHPTVRNNGRNELDVNFVPLLVNATGEIVGYAVTVDKSIIFVLPQLMQKADLLVELFDELASAFPTVFPYNGMFGWLDDGSYPLPGEQVVRKRRIEIEEKYIVDVAENESEIVRLKDDFKFLRVMLSGTGDELVNAVREYLVWLGFVSAKAMDLHRIDILEEDIQIQLDPGLLVVEVKGIGGTSKDKECAQISKIKNRRQEERRAWDVSALYIVNHQRYASPRLRINPPFTQNQIKDALLDKRGMVTTYQLYSAYFYVVSGLITKSDVRDQLLGFGYVNIAPPKLIEIGVVKEIFHHGHTAILLLGDTTVHVGTKLYVLKNDVYEIREVLSLQLDDVDVSEATGSEVGVRLDAAIKNGSRIYIKTT